MLVDLVRLISPVTGDVQTSETVQLILRSTGCCAPAWAVRKEAATAKNVARIYLRLLRFLALSQWPVSDCGALPARHCGSCHGRVGRRSPQPSHAQPGPWWQISHNLSPRRLGRAHEAKANRVSR